MDENKSICGYHINNMERIQAVEESTKSAHKRIDDLQSDNKVLHEMNANIKLLAEQYKTQGKKLDCIEIDVKELKEKPGKRWDSVSMVVIVCIVTTVLGYLLGHFLK